MQCDFLRRGMPGLYQLTKYRREWLADDLRAGLSVAAVALPTALAYADLVGVTAVVGIYSCILPMIAYALFGSSRQVIVGPDAATCAVIAAVVTPLAAGDPQRLWQLCVMMTLMTGLWCLVASRFRLGALADLLSRPILTGLLNGLAITIMIDQLAKMLGYQPASREVIERILSLPHDLLSSHWPTLLLSLLTLLVLLGLRRLRPGWPAALLVIILAMLLVWLGGLQRFGIQTISGLDGTLPVVQWPNFQPALLRDLVMPSLNLALISFVSLMLTARSFASKNGYEVNPDAEFRALGVANIVSALSQGFAISGASSRTAVNDANGGKSQLVSIVAALSIAAVLLLLGNLLRYIPVAVLGVVLVYASWLLLDIRSLVSLRKHNPSAFRLALFTFASVLLVGVMPGIGLAVLLGLLQFFRTVFRPSEQLLGVNEEGMIHSLGNGNQVRAVEGVLIYRFNSPLTYFNIAYFKRRVLNLVDGMPFQPEWVVIDAVSCFTYPDISVLAGIDELKRDLRQRRVHLVLAGRKTDLKRWFGRSRATGEEKGLLFVADLYLALKLIQSSRCAHADGVDGSPGAAQNGTVAPR
ncbi:SulP family inorganic anion transporter [Edwardsiella ictaluri]|uniref:Inorganic anion transporter, sulfate permease (SulP) family n=2 Tax=Edwardsiella ictaluri TaxID=67780 RepID=C5BDB1_EDWI9|nr:SulP family inorganic anion transporter [Edwardsiella ictaluri]ACR68863.1 inorganic anion transporter, sulfate permease (SulP) family [Edwardsiella ictaluri 93-146]AVZ80896.1 SulP family inorganic anion transporter [Edwardsiella ictaluri]EKS7762299.1 SulP family inorganic anion transporter [Edwardsiella ictaluri]EKS7769126.1 SulP family inorganic anion transporter [Edwardsiella ictaluri]EKS7772275.1 SulP family inorganic anion transporter [Edwardsiella ictaluri]